MNLQPSNKPADKILVIGGSMYNQGTPCKIRDALMATNFLEEWAVVFANHDYFYPGSQPHHDKIHNEFCNMQCEPIAQVKSYSIFKQFIYILPGESNFIFKSQGGGIVIEVVSLDGNKLCINQVMKELATNQPKIQIAGLIICGRFNDGAEGLKEIKDKGGKTAVQQPGECYHPDITPYIEVFGNGTDSMPKAALEQYRHQEVSLENPNSSLTLTKWLRSIKSE